jgi:hypothetical protein
MTTGQRAEAWGLTLPKTSGSFAPSADHSGPYTTEDADQTTGGRDHVSRPFAFPEGARFVERPSRIAAAEVPALASPERRTET